MDIETNRLRLRPLYMADAEMLYRHWNEPDVRRFLWDDQAVSMAQVQAAIDTSNQLFHDYQYGLWAMLLKPAGTLVGCCGVRPLADDLELLYSLTRAYWGKGLTTEAAQACLQYVFNTGKPDRIVGIANPDNQASWRVLENVGMKRLGRQQHHQESVLYYAVSRQDFGAICANRNHLKEA